MQVLRLRKRAELVVGLWRRKKYPKSEIRFETKVASVQKDMG